MGEWFFLRLAGMSPERPIGIYENREEDLNTHSGKHNLLLPFSKKKKKPSEKKLRGPCREKSF